MRAEGRGGGGGEGEKKEKEREGGGGRRRRQTRATRGPDTTRGRADKRSDALKKVGEAPSDKLVQFEEEQRTLPFHSDLNLTKSHFKAINLATTEGLKNYFDAIDMARRCLHDMDLAMSSVETINAIDRYLAEINRVKSYLEDMDRVNYLVEEKKSDDGDETQSEDSGEQ